MSTLLQGSCKQMEYTDSLSNNFLLTLQNFLRIFVEQPCRDLFIKNLSAQNDVNVL